VARIRETRNAYRILARKRLGKECFKDREVDGRIQLDGSLRD
jgi:hypothetical protein